ncbi:M23 family metallopeptidase [Angustibacter sp. McL0619]|uniref:M23 family metallopeptidase n=1 Tax=Angustibacter sp. McL0619 TaxID=3415676 RepID=UPI003CEED4B2
MNAVPKVAVLTALGSGLLAAILVTSTVAGDSSSAALNLAADLNGNNNANCLVTADGTALPSLDGEQSSIVRVIYAAAITAGVGPQGAVVGVATAKQESDLRNLEYGDRDSLGVFQQRAAWAPAGDRNDPVKAARMFFTGGLAGQPGLTDVHGWRAMPVWQAAQAVQVSAFPTAYAKWTALAVSAVTAVSGSSINVADCGQAPAILPGAWTTPVAEGEYRITSDFGPRQSPGGIGSTFHKGLDFAAPIGTTARAAAAGSVTAVKGVEVSGGYGNLIIIDHGGGTSTYYAHLSAVDVRPGQRVVPGMPIGKVGSTGDSTGPHLHFEVRRDGVPIPPNPWLRQHGVTP